MSLTLDSNEVIDRQLWADIATVPDRPLRALVARRLVRRALKTLPLRVVTADGRQFGAGGPGDPVLRLVRPDAFYQRLGAGGLIGFGEAFMAGDWVADDVVGVLTVLARRLEKLVPPVLQRFRGLAVHTRPGADRNTVDGARENIHRHYDLSNELFSLFLDPTMTYSSALFDANRPYDVQDLAEAQQRKADRLLDIAGVRAGSRVIEIGTGWGELAVRAAARGAQVTTTTISHEQAQLARERVTAAGYADRVDIREQDYRDVTGEFDALISVEMIEAVGSDYWPDYFGTIERLLAPGGRAALQAITMPHDRMLASAHTYTWILKYIFPGGQIPSVTAVSEHAHRAGLQVATRFAFGADYAETLRRWRARFEDRADEVQELGFDVTFRKMWSLYLAYSEAGFRSDYLDVVGFELTKPGSP